MAEWFKHVIGCEEVAIILGYDPKYVPTLCREGKLPCARAGKCWVFDRREIERIAAKRPPAPTD